jgi:hypothetical protein
MRGGRSSTCESTPPRATKKAGDRPAFAGGFGSTRAAAFILCRADPVDHVAQGRVAIADPAAKHQAAFFEASWRST